MFNNAHWQQGSATDMEAHGSTQTAPSIVEKEVDIAYRFLGATVIWFDLLSCISLDREPRTMYESWLSRHGVEMSNVMGCQNWAMIEIGNIARFAARKLEAERSNRLSMRELVSESLVIEDKLERGIQESYAIEKVQIVAFFTNLLLIPLADRSEVQLVPHHPCLCACSTCTTAYHHFRPTSRYIGYPPRCVESTSCLARTIWTSNNWWLSVADLHSRVHG